MNIRRLLLTAAAAAVITTTGASMAYADPPQNRHEDRMDRRDNRQDNRQDNRMDRRDNRMDNRMDRRDDRMDNRMDRRDARHDRYWHEGYHGYVDRDRVFFSLRQHHYTRFIGNPYWYQGRYVVRSYDRFGHVVFVEVNPYTGGFIGVIRF